MKGRHMTGLHRRELVDRVFDQSDMDRLVEILVLNAQRASVGSERLVDTTSVEKAGRGAIGSGHLENEGAPEK